MINEDAIKVKGLFLQGADFSDRAGKLVDPPNNLPEFVPLPICYMVWLPNKEEDPYPEEETGDFPVFISSTRENILCKLRLPN